MSIRRWVLAVMALVAVGATGIVYYRATFPPAPDLGPLTPSAAAAHRPPRQPLTSQVPMGELLLREVVRQGWLVAQRDGLGLRTRDALLREPPLTTPPPAPEIDVKPYQNQTCELAAGKWKMSIPADQWKGYPGLVATVERLSRTEFVTALKSMGRDGVPNHPHAGSPPDLTKANRALDELNFFSQFTAARLAHASIRNDGESPEALAVLTRAYANLGQLTRCLYNATGHGMAARSLIYAQRMLAAAPPGDADAQRAARWHRAYAMAMAGLQSVAIDDLAAAAKVKADGGDAPDWVRALDAYCHYRTSGLVDLTAEAPAERVQLPAFLAYLTIEHTASPSALNQFGRAVLQGEPDNLRVVDATATISGVAANHELTLYALASTSRLSVDRAAKLPDVPAPVVTAARRAVAAKYAPKQVAAVAAALVDASASDDGEPSWAALGRMVQDAHFLNVQRRIYFEAKMWAVDPTESAASLMPLVADHPYAPIVKLLAATRAPWDERNAVVKDLKVVDPQMKMMRMLAELDAAGLSPTGGPTNVWGNLVLYHLDTTTIDAEQLYAAQAQAHKDHAVQLLRECCPQHPAVIANQIATDWPAVAPRVDELTKSASGSPLITAALGRHYSEAKDWPKAEQYLRQYIGVCKDLWAYQLLADDYLAQGDEARWQSTMEEFLQQPDYRLDHAMANVAIAKHYMKQSRYDKAEPFADAAAQSWAAWAMDVAAQCEEKLGHWDAAELWVKRQQERYGPPTLWLDWCSRTGHGDRAAAQRAAGGGPTNAER